MPEMTYAEGTLLQVQNRRIAELEAENERLREQVEQLEMDYHLLSSEMVYEGNSVQHWRLKALAYKRCAGIVSDIRQAIADMDKDQESIFKARGDE